MLSENRIELSFFELCKIGLKEISEGMLRLMRRETKKVIIHQF